MKLSILLLMLSIGAISTSAQSENLQKSNLVKKRAAMESLNIEKAIIYLSKLDSVGLTLEQSKYVLGQSVDETTMFHLNNMMKAMEKTPSKDNVPMEYDVEIGEFVELDESQENATRGTKFYKCTKGIGVLQWHRRHSQGSCKTYPWYRWKWWWAPNCNCGQY